MRTLQNLKITCYSIIHWSRILLNADGEVEEELDETDVRILALLQEDAFGGIP
jgi:hypothetical protein